MTFCNMAEEYHFNKIEQLIDKKIDISPIPDNVTIEKTPFVEQQEMLREIDFIKRKENPDFKGAFHDKKKKRNKR